MRFPRPRFRFADVTALLALFVALGGTGYAAAKLPGNSVGSSQIRTGAVGKSEIRTGGVGTAEVRTGGVSKSELATNSVGAIEIRKDAVDGTEVRDGGLEAADLSTAARSALTDASAVTFRSAVTSTGAAAAGNAKGASRSAAGEYAVDLGRDASACQVAATLASVKNGATVDPAKAGFITAAADGNAVRVSIKDPTGAALDAPFHLLVAC